MSNLDHIFLNGNNSSLPYSTYGGGKFYHKDGRDRRGHGTGIKRSFQSAVYDFTDGNEDYEFVYIEFESAINFELAFDSFEDAAGNYRLASCKAVFNEDTDGNSQVVYKIAVYLNKKAVSNFLNKVEKYLTEETKTGKPKNQNLIANIESIRAATLESFWQEPEIDFPTSNVSVWWEVWFSDSKRENVKKTLNSLASDTLLTNNRILVFPENIVGLIKGTPEELSEKLLYIDNLSEIRKPIETADFFLNLDKNWEGNFIDDLRNRIKNQIEQNNISVCLLDSGVNRVNPLLEDIIPEENLDSINPAWTNKVTLSYFIEPNPGNKRYASDQSYKSHGLRFKMIDRNESQSAFEARVSKAIKDGQDNYIAEGSENWILGSQVRDKGSIHKDIWVGSAADLALRNKLAVFPVGGWWKSRKKLNRYDSSVRYSLVISIEADALEIDLYNNVLNQIRVSIPIEN